MNQSKQAEAIYEQLMESFERYGSDNPDIQIKKYTLLRMANTISDEGISSYYIGRAVAFFRANQSYEKGIINYFIALCNYSGIMIENGEFDRAFKTTLVAKELTQEHKLINFPRPQILANNYLLSGYLSNKISVEDCIDLLESVISELPKNAERLFFSSNLSIFYALNNQFNTALERLHKESIVQQSSKDSEGKYNARVLYNSSVFNFLLGNQDTAINYMNDHLERQKELSGHEKNQEIQRAEQALEVMEENEKVYNGEEWLEVLLKNKVVGKIRGNDVNQTPENYRKLGYMFTSLYNWDI